MAVELETTELTPEEEQKLENEALEGANVKDEDLRKKLAEDFGVDPEEQSEILDKLVAREKENRKRLSKAIEQKKTWRSKAEKAAPPENRTDKLQTPEQIDAMVDKRLDEREFDRLDLSDDLKEEARKLAKAQGIPLMDAAKDPYIAFKKTEKEKEKKLERATPRPSGKGFYSNNVDTSKPLDPNDYDFSTEEGRKAWDQAKAAYKKARQA